ncbi:MAG: polysaccharide deacetylase family protein [Bacteroidales bacterium]|nr:polysaccharide deacetylase family protein [Bacteroidales bacterium]
MSKITSYIRKLLLMAGSVVRKNHNSKLLYYHDVFGDKKYTDMGTSLNLFRQHVSVIKKEGYRIVPKITKKEGEVAILFDDGFRGIYDVRQVFYDEGICPTVFLAVELIGKECYLTKEEILELQEHGFVFECHAWSHEDLTTFSDEELIRELKDSKEYLSELLGKEVSEICLPIGYFSDHLLEKIRKYGYATIYSSAPGDYETLIHGNMRARNLLQSADTDEVKYILRGGNNLLKQHYINLHYKKIVVNP